MNKTDRIFITLLDSLLDTWLAYSIRGVSYIKSYIAWKLMIDTTMKNLTEDYYYWAKKNQEYEDEKKERKDDEL